MEKVIDLGKAFDMIHETDGKGHWFGKGIWYDSYSVVCFLALITMMITKVDHGNHHSNHRSNHRGFYYDNTWFLHFVISDDYLLDV